mgnify:CR=1 FL=1
MRLDNYKFITIIISFFIICFSCVGCVKLKDKTALTVAFAGETETLDPALSYDGVTHGNLLNIYDTLIRFKGESTSEFEPLISLQVPTQENGLISQDGLTYTFPIRQDIKFSDGSALTIDDVVYSLQRFVLTGVSGSGKSTLMQDLILALSVFPQIPLSGCSYPCS